MFKGYTAEIPLGAKGLVGTKNTPALSMGHLIQADNVAYTRGTVSKEGGAVKYNSTVISGAPTVIGGWDWWPIAATQRMVVVLGDGTMKKDDGSGTFATTLASGLTTSASFPFFMEGGKEVAANNRKLFIYTGVNQVKVLSADGATVASIATPPADWAASFPAAGLIHKDRHWGFGNPNDPHRLYYTMTTNHEDFTGAGSGSISVYSGEGEKIVAAVSFKGLIIVFKYPFGTYMVDTRDPTVTNWRVDRLNRAVGSVSPQSVVLIDDDIVVLQNNGNFQLLSAVQDFGNLGTDSLSAAVYFDTFMVDNINIGSMSDCRAIFYPAKREVQFALPKFGSSLNDAKITLDLNIPDLPRFRTSTRDTIRSLWLRKDSSNILRPVAGDSSGFVWRLDQDTKSKDGNAYLGIIQTPPIDFSEVDPNLATVRKNGAFLEIVGEQLGNFNLIVDAYWDNRFAHSMTFNMGSSGAVLGSFVLGTDALGGDAVAYRRRKLRGSGKRLSLVIKNQEVNGDFSIAKIFVSFMPSNEKKAVDE
jgi:hypothetical protein